MAENKDDLSDRAHFDPNWIAWNGGYLHSNNVLFYFATSPFFDQVSGNQSLFSQWVNTPNQNDILGTRAKFEANLRLQRGVQYVVEHDPLEQKATFEGPNGPENTNVWVIRKQNRQNETDQGVTVLAYYYIVNNVIYQAPSVANILSNRLLNTVSALNELFDAPADLSLFSISHGHTYYKPVQPSTRQVLSSQTQQSREGSVVPDSQLSAAEKASTAPSSQAQEDTSGGVRTAWEALRMTISYGKEYSDDMPLVGEPGNFRFSKNKDSGVASSQPKSQSQLSSSPNETPGQSRATSVVALVSSGTVAAPKGKTVEKASSVANGAGKIKRRKSRGDGGSP